MKSKIQVLSENSDYKTLINAVVNNIGMDNIMNVVQNGINGGYNGFIFYSETHKFAMRHRKNIVSLLEHIADDMGEDIVDMVSGFGVFKNSPMDSQDKKELYKYIGGGRPTQGTITNTMAWFAAEEVCRMFDE